MYELQPAVVKAMAGGEYVDAFKVSTGKPRDVCQCRRRADKLDVRRRTTATGVISLEPQRLRCEIVRNGERPSHSDAEYLFGFCEASSDCSSRSMAGSQ
jgi:hypothetical protein